MCRDSPCSARLLRRLRPHRPIGLLWVIEWFGGQRLSCSSQSAAERHTQLISSGRACCNHPRVIPVTSRLLQSPAGHPRQKSHWSSAEVERLDLGSSPPATTRQSDALLPELRDEISSRKLAESRYCFDDDFWTRAGKPLSQLKRHVQLRCHPALSLGVSCFFV